MPSSPGTETERSNRLVSCLSITLLLLWNSRDMIVEYVCFGFVIGIGNSTDVSVVVVVVAVVVPS